MVKPHSSNFRVITTNVLGVRKLRIITVPTKFAVAILMSTHKICSLRRIEENNPKIEPAHEIMVLITKATSDGSGEPAHLHSLARAFTVCTHEVWKVKR